jgi:acetyl esterase/lipase
LLVEGWTTNSGTCSAVYYHGGNFTVGSRALLPQAHREKLLELGFVVVSVDYRLSPTISADEGAVKDSLDAYKWAHSELPALLKKDGVDVDSSKIVSLGHSCGGTLALLTVSEPMVVD